MGHESGNEVEPDLGKKPARTKMGSTSRLLNRGRWGILWITSDPQKWNNPGEQVPSLRIAALREGIAGASASKKNQGSIQPGTKFPDRAMGQ
jgi:hypothetical protein